VPATSQQRLHVVEFWLPHQQTIANATHDARSERTNWNSAKSLNAKSLGAKPVQQQIAELRHSANQNATELLRLKWMTKPNFLSSYSLGRCEIPAAGKMQEYLAPMASSFQTEESKRQKDTATGQWSTPRHLRTMEFLFQSMPHQ
jgi:hypothetical protein